MAIGTPYSLGSNTSGAGANTLQMTVSATSAAGDAIIVGASVNSNSAATSPSACADSQGNQYTKVATSGSGAEYQGTLFIATESASGGPTTPLASGTDTITVTYTTSTAATGHNVQAMGCSGIAQGSTAVSVDQTAFNGNTSSGTTVTATLPATAQTGELIVVLVTTHDTANSVSWNSPLTQVNGPVVYQTNQNGFLAAGVSTTTASTAYGGTVSLTGKWECVLASLLPASGPTAVSLADVAAAVGDQPGNFAPAAAVPLAEQGAAVDDQPGDETETAAVALADAAAGVDDQLGDLTASAAVPLAEQAAGTDVPSDVSAVVLADTAAAVDDQPGDLVVAASGPEMTAYMIVRRLNLRWYYPRLITPAVPPVTQIALADSAAAVEALTLSITLSPAETAGVVDALGAAATVALADLGAAEDGDTAGSSGSAITLADTAAAADSLTVAAAVQADDVACAADGVAPAAATPLLDTAGAAESIAAQEAGPEAESAAAADQITVSVSFSLADTAAAADTGVHGAQINSADFGAAADALAGSASVSLADASGAADSLAAAETSATVSLTDASGAHDSLSVSVLSPGGTGDVVWSARPAPGRWKTTPLPGTWHVSIAAGTWGAEPAPGRWEAAAAAPMWEVIMANFSPVSALSLANINATWTSSLAGTSVDPTGQTEGQAQLEVQFAFPVSSGNPSAPSEPVTWFTGSWLLDGTAAGYVAQCLVGPGGGVLTLTAGQSYDVWSKITGSPESPCIFVGTQPVY
jgi:hypothetical protein